MVELNRYFLMFIMDQLNLKGPCFTMFKAYLLSVLSMIFTTLACDALASPSSSQLKIDRDDPKAWIDSMASQQLPKALESSDPPFVKLVESIQQQRVYFAIER